MPEPQLPLLIEPELLQLHLHSNDVCIIDLNKLDVYRRTHIPGAIHLDYQQIVRIEKPVMGLLPNEQTLSKLFSTLGINQDTHLVAYDDESGARACRLLYTLDVIDHPRYSLLNGGSIAWINEGHPLEQDWNSPTPTRQYPALINHWPIASKEYILQHLDDPEIVLVDARSIEEYTGVKRFAERGGHIPGAVHLDWREALDTEHNARAKHDDLLKDLFEARGVVPEKEVITYCQSHHRSSYIYFLLRKLGYERIRGYPGAWSEWGNCLGLPVESGTR